MLSEPSGGFMDWKSVFWEPVMMMLSKFAQFIPVFVGFLLVLLLGWLIASGLKKILVRFLVLVKLDSLSGKTGFSKLLENAGIKNTLSEIVGIIVYWIIIIITLSTAVNALGLANISNILDKIIIFIPNVIIAIIILILGLFFSTFLSSIVITACTNAGISQSKLLGKITSTIVIIFTIILAVQQLNLKIEIINSIITIIIASVGLAFAIAIGLGGKDIASKWIKDLDESLRNK
ncbi:MAG: hypothetical protein A2474_02745 [Elusimicrobia bacterium RIFOXYC2_FULL_34_12]|nr:MAG: hypothetical protein A2474_02745 [Elusimicrobia bacterium RIFOXYC2_FULL_34_12]HAM38357.1 hypothetical protein [Elusimicrobiota bacterium]